MNRNLNVVAKKRTRRVVKHQRAVVGASLEKIQQRRNEKPEDRQKSREEAIKRAKEEKKAQQEKKRAERAKSQASKSVKNIPKAKPGKGQASSKR